MKKIIYVGLIFAALGLASCDVGNEPDIQGTATQKVAGEWFLQLSDDDKNVIVPYNLFTTTNTSANGAGEMWFIDHDVFGAQSKLNIDQTGLNFSSTNSVNLDYEPGDAPDETEVVKLGTIKKVVSPVPQTVTIADGIVLKDSFIAPSKAKTDSMYLRITGNYNADTYEASEYKITTANGVKDTTVVWKLTGSAVEPDGPYVLSGYRRTGFREDEH